MEPVKQVADLLGHSTTQVTEMYYVKKDSARLNGITKDFNLYFSISPLPYPQIKNHTAVINESKPPVNWWYAQPL